MADDEALVGNAGDRKQVERARAKEARRARRLAAAWASVAHSPDGQLVLGSLLDEFSAYASVFDDSPHRTAYNAGRQDAAHRIMRHVDETSPTALFTLMQCFSKEMKNA